MSVGAKFSARYFLARVENALQAVRKDLSSSGADAGFFQRFQEAYKQQLTTVMAITGAAMAPAINPGGPFCSCGQQLLQEGKGCRSSVLGGPQQRRTAHRHAYMAYVWLIQACNMPCSRVYRQ